MKNGMKRVFKIILVIFVLLAVLAAVAYFFFNPYLGSTSDWKKQNVKLQQVLSKKQATEDLDLIKDKVQTLHYSARNGLPSAFLGQYHKEIAGLSEEPTILQVWQAGCRILHTLEDGHSSVYEYIDERSYSGADYSISNGVVYIKLNNRMFRVNKVCTTDINLLRKNAYAQLSYENDIYRDAQFLSCLQKDAELEWLGCPNFNEYTVEYDNGGKTHIATIEQDQKSQSHKSDPWVSFRIDKENNVGILTLNKCKDNDVYKKALNDFFSEVKESKIENIAVDLRKNPGGASYAAHDFIRYLNIDQYKDFTSYHRLKSISFKDPISTTKKNNKATELLFKGKVYVLTSPATFSDAMQFSVLLQDNKLAQVIGEPSGNRPCQNGEVVTFLLPNSKMYFCTTYAYFERPDESKASAPYQVPDYTVPSGQALDKLYTITRRGLEQ